MRLRCLLRPRERGAWIAIALGILSFSAGDLYWSIVLNGGANIPYPSWADAGYLGFYPATYVGIALLLRSRFVEIPAGLGLDGVIGALAVAALGAVALFGPVLSDTHGAPLTVATNLAYPLADLLLLGIVTGIIALAGRRGRAGWLPIALGLVVFAVADSIYLIQTAEQHLRPGRPARRRLAGRADPDRACLLGPHADRAPHPACPTWAHVRAALGRRGDLPGAGVLRPLPPHLASWPRCSAPPACCS